MYCYALKLRVGRFSGDFSDKTTADISTADIDSWLAGLGVAPGTRNTYRRDPDAVLFLHHPRLLSGKSCHWLTASESYRFTNRGLTPDQLSILLKNANPLVVPYIAIGAFAGYLRQRSSV